ncbi:hypothetical protein [Pseudomonas synxantha]|nr:hypothetical protein [Pseudomonas synxantha]
MTRTENMARFGRGLLVTAAFSTLSQPEEEKEVDVIALHRRLVTLEMDNSDFKTLIKQVSEDVKWLNGIGEQPTSRESALLMDEMDKHYTAAAQRYMTLRELTMDVHEYQQTDHEWLTPYELLDVFNSPELSARLKELYSEVKSALIHQSREFNNATHDRGAAWNPHEQQLPAAHSLLRTETLVQELVLALYTQGSMGLTCNNGVYASSSPSIGSRATLVRYEQVHKAQNRHWDDRMDRAPRLHKTPESGGQASTGPVDAHLTWREQVLALFPLLSPTSGVVPDDSTGGRENQTSAVGLRPTSFQPSTSILQTTRATSPDATLSTAPQWQMPIEFHHRAIKDEGGSVTQWMGNFIGGLGEVIADAEGLIMRRVGKDQGKVRLGDASFPRKPDPILKGFVQKGIDASKLTFVGNGVYQDNNGQQYLQSGKNFALSQEIHGKRYVYDSQLRQEVELQGRTFHVKKTNPRPPQRLPDGRIGYPLSPIYPSQLANADTPPSADLGREIGRGGEAIVYESLDGKNVYKKLNGDGTSTGLLRSLQGEAELLNKYYGDGFAKAIFEEGHNYIKMKKLDGVSLLKVPQHSLPPNVLDLANDAIKKMEDKGIHHQDLQKENFLYSVTDNKVYPIDIQSLPVDIFEMTGERPRYLEKKDTFLKEVELLIDFTTLCPISHPKLSDNEKVSQ